MPVQFTVNGRPASVDAPANTLLVHALREHLHLTGTHVGCDTSQCGACVVHVDGKAVKSCTTLAAACHGLQCGFCTPGMIMTAVCLLADQPEPTADQIAHALDGNLCRCTGYTNIVESVQLAARTMKEGAR